MAENKKSFVLYSDLVQTTRKLSDEQAGKLFKHILEYVNDTCPSWAEEDALLDIVFTPIRNQLKRDLARWQTMREKRAEAGRKGGLSKGKQAKGSKTKQSQAMLSNAKQSQAKEAVNVNANVNVNVLSKDKETILSYWLDYRKDIGKRIKNKKTIENLREKFAKYPIETIKAVVDASVQNQWQGLFFDRGTRPEAKAQKTAQENLMDSLKQTQ